MTDHIMPDLQRARALLDGIGWNDVQIKQVVGGTVNKTFQLHLGDEAWYLRIGPTDVEVETGPGWFTGGGLRREQQAVALWAGHQQYLPETVHADFSREHIASDWVIQKAMTGDDWHSQRSALSAEEVADLWRQLGTLTAELHAYVGTDFGTPEAGLGTARWSETVRWDATGLLTDAHKFELPIEPFQDLCDLVDRSTDELDEIVEPRLIHSDLGLRHVMVTRNEDNRPMVTGLIDLEFARFADAYSESLFVTQALTPQPDAMFDHFLQAYDAEKPDRDSRLRSLIYQLTALGWWVTDAMRRNRPTEARQILDEMTHRLDEDKHIW